MSIQEIAVYLIVASSLIWLSLRLVRFFSAVPKDKSCNGACEGCALKDKNCVDSLCGKKL